MNRYEDSEIAALYDGYRGDRYFEQRHRHEPWYTRSFNDAIGGADEIERRNQRLARFLTECGVSAKTRTVLDWGGDRGQFIPPMFEERYVYDISGIEPMPGVTAVARADLSTRHYDLVLLAHVLEHAADPIALLDEVLATPTTYFYVEVPFEPFRPRAWQTTSAYARWVEGIAASRFYPLVAFVSVASRVKLGRMPPFGVFEQHEHLNFFTSDTLTRMLEAVGCHVVAATSYRKHDARGPVEALGVLAKTNRASAGPTSD